MILLSEGYYAARPTGAQLSTAKTGTEQVVVGFELLDGTAAGQHISWTGFFTEKTWERTIESLRYCGFEGNDLSDLSAIGSANVEVSLDIGVDEYEGKTRNKVQWVNKPGGGLSVSNPMDTNTAKTFAARMKAKIGAMGARGGVRAAPSQQRMGGSAPLTERNPPPPRDDEIPF